MYSIFLQISNWILFNIGIFWSKYKTELEFCIECLDTALNNLLFYQTAINVAFKYHVTFEMSVHKNFMVVKYKNIVISGTLWNSFAFVTQYPLIWYFKYCNFNMLSEYIVFKCLKLNLPMKLFFSCFRWYENKSHLMHMAFVTKAVSLKQNSIHLRKLHSRDILKIFLPEIGSFNESIYFELPHDSVFMLWMHLEIIVGRSFFVKICDIRFERLEKEFIWQFSWLR